MIEPNEHTLLDKPDVVTTYDENGEIVCHNVRLRYGRAVRGVQPIDKLFVFFQLGSDGLPVSICLFAPVDETIVKFAIGYIAHLIKAKREALDLFEVATSRAIGGLNRTEAKENA